jgi:glucose-6-phosphate isomerase, archaeal
MKTITEPEVVFTGTSLFGHSVEKLTRTITDLKGLFQDQKAFEDQDPQQIAYEVESYFPVKEGTEGGLFFGVTRLQPGMIGQEYMMTKGHSHVIEDRAEFYWGIEGEGMMLFMDKDRNMRAERMFPGSLHYIKGFTAHRVANTGTLILSFGACWPSDAGHNYEMIAKNGFSKRLKKIDGEPQLV